MSFEKVWVYHPKLFKAVESTHAVYGVTGGAHDFTHAVAVAQMVYRIAERADEWRLYAVLAALCHNADRLVQHKLHLGRNDEPEREIRELVTEWLAAEFDGACDPVCEREVLMAVLDHSKQNADSDSPATILLKDADRLVNTLLSVVMRAGKYFEELPPFDPRGRDVQTATFRNPVTVLRSLEYNCEWLKVDDPAFRHVCLRSPKAIAFGEMHRASIERYVRDVRAEVVELFGDEYPV